MTANAEEAGFQFALTPEAAIHSTGTPIHGLTLNFVGQNEQHGLTLGIGNIMTGQSYGFSLGLVNKADSYRGVQWGFVNCTSENYDGCSMLSRRTGRSRAKPLPKNGSAYLGQRNQSTPEVLDHRAREMQSALARAPAHRSKRTATSRDYA